VAVVDVDRNRTAALAAFAGPLEHDSSQSPCGVRQLGSASWARQASTLPLDVATPPTTPSCGKFLHAEAPPELGIDLAASRGLW
jgi:hypothetical protein